MKKSHEDTLAESLAKTEERFERQHKSQQEQGYGHTREFAAAARELIPLLSEHIRDRIKSSLPRALQALAPEKIALAGIASLMHNDAAEDDDDESRHTQHMRQALDIGQWIYAEVFVAGLSARTQRRLARTHQYNARVRIFQKLGYRPDNWDEITRLKVGNWFLNRCLTALPDVFVRRDGRVTVCDDARATIQFLRERTMLAHPALLPCTDPPKPWIDFRDGGFWDERSRIGAPFVRGHYKQTEPEVRAAFRDGSMAPHVNAVNALQAVPFRINEAVLDKVKQYGERLLVDKGKLHKTALDDDIAIAEKRRGAPFYVPINCDRRGRLYGIPRLNFQREDHVRALFLFDRTTTARPAPLAAVAPSIMREALSHQVACTGGFEGVDKQSFRDRSKWVEQQNWELVEKTALGKDTRWLDADKPFGFFAACLEKYEERKHGREFITRTRLPVEYDATCSGLQHIVAMTRDPLGAKLVNLTGGMDNEPPADIYTVVARRVAAAADEEFAGIEIDRKLVKTCVMTYGYSVTIGWRDPETRSRKHPRGRAFGMLGQLEGVLKDRGQELDDKHLRRLAKMIIDAIEDEIPTARHAREWLRRCVWAIEARGGRLRWTSSSGFPVVNRYLESKSERVDLTLSGISVTPYVADGHTPKSRPLKAANAIVPNLVHSCDAAFLARGVNGCALRGIDLITVHDCFAVRAPDAHEANLILRDEFGKMHEERDPLAEIYLAVTKAGGKVRPPPPRGSFNLWKTRAWSPYAIS